MLENDIAVKKQKDGYETTRLMYIFEAAFEYFITLALGGAYISRITAYLGIADSITAILISFLSLGHVMQLFAVLIAHIRPVKHWVTAIHIFSQLLAVFLYFIPVFNFSIQVKTVFLIVSLALFYIMHNAIYPSKMTWFMSVVDNSKRGEFTAIKEIVSLLGGSLFVYLLGYSLDIANQKIAFTVVGCLLMLVTALHTITLIFSKEKPVESVQKVNFKETVLKLLKNKGFIRVVIIFSVWYTINHGVVSFLGTYQVKELGFTATTTSLISIVAQLFRAVLSRKFGRYGDQNTFLKLIRLSFIIEAIAFTFMAFTVPSNGIVMFSIYSVLHSVGMSGISICISNLTYEVVDVNDRTSAYAIVSSTSIFGFLITLVLSPILDVIQNNGNVVLGIPMYAQQLFAIIATIALTVVVIWLSVGLKKKKAN